MIKQLLVVIMLFSFHHLFSNSYHNISFLSPEIKTKTYLLNLQQQPDKDTIFIEESITESNFSSPFTSLTSFRNALSEFVSSTEQRNSIFDYSVKDTPNGRLQVSLIAGADYHSNFDEHYLNFYRGVQLKANFNNRLLMWGNWWAARFQGDLDYAEATSPLIKGWYKSHNIQTYTNLNRINGQITYLFDFGNLTIGRGTHQIGDSISGSIILNNESNDYGYFSSELLFGKLSLHFLHATLIPDNPDSNYDYLRYVNKFLVLHHIKYQARKNLSFYFGEEIIYANRSIDASYLLPHTFYRITEHNLRDLDNVLIYTGFQWQASDIFYFYGSLILDELKKSEIFGDWWGNKYALQGGIAMRYGSGIFSNDRIRTVLEFTAVRPWMYTHNSDPTIFSHDGIGLGFSGAGVGDYKGSNLIQGAGELNIPLFANLSFDQFFSYTIQGSLGESFSINYNDRPKDTAKWLEGDKRKITRGKTALSFSLFSHHKLKVGLDWHRVDNNDWNQELIISYQAKY